MKGRKCICFFKKVNRIIEKAQVLCLPKVCQMIGGFDEPCLFPSWLDIDRPIAYHLTDEKQVDLGEEDPDIRIGVKDYS